METNDEQHDVVVVGARCAGAATALLLASQGHDVVVVDRATFPSDTLSTCAMARTGVVQLQRWGLLDAVLDSGAPPIRDVVFHTAAGTIEKVVKDRSGVDHVLAPRRYVLDQIVLDAAERAGATVRTGTTVTGVRRDGAGRAVGVEVEDDAGPGLVRGRFVVGADGLRSRVARSVEAPMVVSAPDGGAATYTFVDGDWPAMEYFIADAAFAGIFPTHGGACIWVCTTTEEALEARRRTGSPEAALDQMVRRTSPELAVRMAAAHRTSHTHTMARMPNHIRQATGPGWALVGDAGCHRDAITGHGISEAFRDAELLADALGGALRGDVGDDEALRTYGHQRDRMLREIFDLTCELGGFPPLPRFIELQKQLAHAIEDEAAAMAARPPLCASLC